MQKEDIKRLEASEMWIWRRIMKVKWTDHKTNEEMLNMVGEKKMLLRTMRERQKNWVGHILRSDSLLQLVWEERLNGKKVAGKPRMKLLDWMIHETDNRRYGELKRLASDSNGWRTWNP